MRLIYLDEAGKSNPSHEPYLVVAGVIVDGDGQWKAIENGLREIVCEYVPAKDRSGFVFHATEVFSGGKYFNREEWPKEKRWEILDCLVALITKHRLPIVHGYVDRAKLFENVKIHLPEDGWARSHQDMLAHGLAYADCAWRAQQWLDVYSAKEVAMLIAEDVPRTRRFLKAVHANLRDPNSEIFKIEDVPLMPLSKIVDTIHFAGKHETSILQLADVASFCLKRLLMGKDDRVRFGAPILAGTLWPPDRAERLRAWVDENASSEKLSS